MLIDDTLYVGAPSDNADGTGAGGVYVFEYEDSAWTQVDRLTASDAGADDSFGGSVAVDGDVAVFGNGLDSQVDINAGSAYVFQFDGDTWVESAKLLASDGGPDDNFGYSVAVSGDTALIGASFDEILGKGHSSAYLYDGLGTVDCNENGVADNCDIAHGTSQDCSGDGIPSEREPDCNDNGIADDCDISFGTADDCNENGIPDECDTVASQHLISTSAAEAWAVVAADLDGDGDSDVLSASGGDDRIAWYENTDGLGIFGPQQVITTAADGASTVFVADLDGDGDNDVLSASSEDDKIAWYVIAAETDCNANVIPDSCDIGEATSLDCAGNGIPDECDIAEGTSDDCNLNGIPDECDLAGGTSVDENGTGVLDECEAALFVDEGAGGGNDGSSWTDAFTSLQDALTVAAANDVFHTEIWVAAGAYLPADPGGDRSDTFALINDVAIYGGFSGSEVIRAERDWATNITVLSGDLNADDPNSDCCQANRSPGCSDGDCEEAVCSVLSSCCDLEWDEECADLAATLCGDCAGGFEDNSYHVVTGSGTDETAILDGFTVTAGHADGVDADGDGGGLYIIQGSPTISNCVVAGNFADAGGGMYTLDGSPVLFNCLFNGNLGDAGGGLRTSGGLLTLVNCTFGENHSLGVGGGIYAFSGALGVTNCILWGNTGEVDPTVEASQILLLASSAVVSYTGIEGLDTFEGNGNIGSDPFFSSRGPISAYHRDRPVLTRPTTLRFCWILPT